MKLVFATNNLNKLSEVQALVPKGIKILSLKDIDCNEELPETNPTIEENALQKARFVFDNYGYSCFADDTGLEIEALNGEPGVYSARYAGEGCTADDNINLVLHKLDEQENRSAVFRTIIALIIDGKESSFEGVCRGDIIFKRSGAEGFGYDPIFKPTGNEKTFAEMSKDEKGLISHRAKAVAKFLKYFKD